MLKFSVKVQGKATGAFPRPLPDFLRWKLSVSTTAEYCEQTDNFCEQRHTFHEGCGKDHVSTDFTGCFGLTSDRFESGSCQATDTKTGSDSCEACSEASTCNCVHSAFVLIN